VKQVLRLLPAKIDDELGKAVGLEDLEELRQELRQQMQRDYDAASRLRLKRNLLDRLAESYDFPVPPGMVDLEFENIWRQYLSEKERESAAQPEAVDAEARQAPADETTGEGGQPAGAEGDAEPPGAEGAAAAAGETATAQAPPSEPAAENEDAMKAEYRRIAERRVRLGLLLAEVGRSNNITVTQDEMNQAITREARRHPGYERQVLDFYRQNPEASGNLRAPIFEDKVIDFIVELAKVRERKINPQELLSLPDPDASEAESG
jgi:trigger factor